MPCMSAIPRPKRLPTDVFPALKGASRIMQSQRVSPVHRFARGAGQSIAAFVVLSLVILLVADSAFAQSQDAVQILDRRTENVFEVLEFLVTPSGLFPKQAEAPPGDYVLVLRRSGFEAPLSLSIIEVSGRKNSIMELSEKGRFRREILRLKPGTYTVSVFGSTEETWSARIRIDANVRERSFSN